MFSKDFDLHMENVRKVLQSPKKTVGLTSDQKNVTSLKGKCVMLVMSSQRKDIG